MKSASTHINRSGPSGVHVFMDDGRATLTGVVDSLWKRLRTAEMIAGNRRVTKVANHLAIVPTNSAADRKIAVSVVDGIYAVDGVASDSVNVRVGFGVVTLTGVVSTDRARRMAGKIAGNVDGVQRVSNQLVVGQG